MLRSVFELVQESKKTYHCLRDSAIIVLILHLLIISKPSAPMFDERSYIYRKRRSFLCRQRSDYHGSPVGHVDHCQRNFHFRR
jgi:hypothetical protein